MSFKIDSPEVAQAVSEHVGRLLAEMVQQGASEASASQASECAGKLFGIIAQYQDAGLMAMGCVGETLVRLFNLD